MADSVPLISSIFTGGTISMTHDAADGSAVPTLSGRDIQAAVPGLETRFELDSVQFGSFPGPHMTLERMLELHHCVRQALDRSSVGTLIAHGTDTLEESATLLDLLHDDPRPVVFVGAMRTKDDLSWDGPVNLFGACLVAGSPLARERGVMVTMNNTIHAATEVTKTYTEAIDTFVTPDYGPLGVIELGQVRFYRSPLRRRTLPVPKQIPTVHVIEAVAGSDGSILRAAAETGGCQGLVVAAMGRGNLPPAMAEVMAELCQSGLPVVVTSRCWGGHVAPVYGYPGGGARLLDAGAIFAPWLTAPKARIWLALALAAGLGRDDLRKLFDSPG